MQELYCESKDTLIKVFDIDRKTNVAYIINTLLNIMNRWNNIRIYIYNINEELNNKETGILNKKIN